MGCTAVMRLVVGVGIIVLVIIHGGIISVVNVCSGGIECGIVVL